MAFAIVPDLEVLEHISAWIPDISYRGYDTVIHTVLSIGESHRAILRPLYIHLQKYRNTTGGTALHRHGLSCRDKVFREVIIQENAQLLR